MNVERILAVADAIENHLIPDLGFNMRFLLANAKRCEVVDHSGHNCGTVACIAGWTTALRNAALPTSFEEVKPHLEGTWLGLTSDQWNDLFMPNPYVEQWENITQARAVRTLRHLAATGEVDWSVK